MFLAPKFFWGRAPEFLYLRYKIEPDSYRVAKFDGDRPRELGDLALKKKKHHEHFIRLPVTTYERPKDAVSHFQEFPRTVKSNESD